MPNLLISNKMLNPLFAMAIKNWIYKHIQRTWLIDRDCSNALYAIIRADQVI